MPKTQMDFNEVLLVGIIRGIENAKLIPVIEAVIRGGLTTFEITMNTRDAAALIRRTKDSFSEKISIGAGTVVDLSICYEAIAAGADFIVAPNFDNQVAAECLQAGVPYIPGALTPTEISRAWQPGVPVIKVFPVGAMGGASYIRDLKGPFDQIKLMACGGVTPSNIKDFFHAGVSAVAIGSQIFNQQWISDGDFSSIERAASTFVEQVKLFLE